MLGGPKGPGLIILIPIIDKMVKVDLRTITFDVPPQDVITKDNVSVKVNAVVYFRALDPNKAINNVENYFEATSQIAQTSLRAILGQVELDELLSKRGSLASRRRAARLLALFSELHPAGEELSYLRPWREEIERRRAVLLSALDKFLSAKECKVVQASTKSSPVRGFPDQCFSQLQPNLD